MVKIKLKVKGKVVYKIKAVPKVKTGKSTAKNPTKIYIRDGNLKYRVK